MSEVGNPVGDKPPEQTDLPATLPPSVVKREGPVGYELSRSDDEVDNGRVGVSVSERRSPQVRSVTRRLRRQQPQIECKLLLSSPSN